MPMKSPVFRVRRDHAAVLAALAFPTLVTLVYFVWLAERPSAWQQVAYAIGKVLQFGFPLVWVGLVQKRRWSLRPPRRRELAEGALLGAAILAAMLMLYFGWFKGGGITSESIAAIRAKIAGLGITSLAQFVGLGAFYSLCHSLLEEYYWRWFVFGQLRKLHPLTGAMAVSAAGFTAHHVCVLSQYFGWASGWTGFFSLSVAVGGVLWGALYQRHQSLYGVWVSHLLVDAGIFVVGYDLVFR